jgi:serine phosphatase RsbU (regulator of sigma subunit)
MDTNKKELQFSGANNPLYIIRNKELLDYNATKNPIGFYFNESPFLNHRIFIEQDDVLYLFSDGYKDQFGGERRSKFTRKRFRRLLVNIHHLPMDEQKSLVESTFEDWKADNDQIDDITVVGLRID